ncbi:amino acid/amide ABC transporter membrane protein 2 (HAAT family) /amino acid/amide ABC transporter ATP-binding protein 1 (HAAT family) [Haloactinopolyspora alba]|uniref:Amino acid/amide ABC transporter membrane protein 2 (HAAT family) /amino acid/amide ABC transporter ATP-binding protein 1 (HAAT family) n=1 Tax=Haloactinopolyspora alba TaxID=648780 RepID=A0A2P8DZV0_9ACTN|nr:branched-chain amino acid ABC transporter ATP-binding protein/permease [Haloactinopolyspora alba]PSL02744.1 amino acid/amide ABC transporter membrane protein 2 (HAAT family) /amino acid/amide ABC transporter ATP-binding protein 1 (HAAT family) [Haloactinopolyspora alba]
MFADSSTTFTLIALTGVFAYSFYAVLVAGQLSLGQAGFASLAAFASTQAVPDEPMFGVVPPLAVGIVVGMVTGAFAAFVLGLPVTRLRGVFLAIATLGFAEMIRIVLINQSWTGGAQGLSVPKLVGPPEAWIAVGVIGFWFLRQGGSKLGRALAAIREDELAAKAMGIDVTRYRLAAFVTAGAVAGLFGVLWVHFSRFADPNEFSFAFAVDGLVTTVVGGSTFFLGPLLGSGFFTAVPELQRAVGIEAGWLRPFIAGVLLLVVVLFLPDGFGGLVSKLGRLRRWGGPVLARGSLVPRSPMPDRTMDGTSPPPALPAPKLPPPGDEVVRMSGVSKDYGGVHAVRDVDLEIRGGEILGLIGPNGAGKTTLVNILTGMTEPSAGEVRVLGVRLGGSVPAHRVALAGVSRTFQHSKLFERLSVLDNVLVGTHRVAPSTLLRRMLFLPSARRTERQVLASALARLERVGLAERATTPAGDLAYGDQRRLEIARALAAQPSLLVLDEPAAGMNHVEAAELSELIRTLADDGITVLLIEHNVRMVLDTCTRVVVLDFGEVIASGEPDVVARDPHVVEAYLGTAAEGEAELAVETSAHEADGSGEQ